MAELESPLRAGIVGCGGIAQVIHLPILMKLSQVEVVALCDLDNRKTAFLAKRYGIPQTFNDIEEMFRHTRLDVVFILTPNNMHLPMSMIALRNGTHVFIERPCARNSKETRKISQAAEAAGCHVMVGMHSRFRSDIRTVKGFIDNGTLGELYFIQGQWLQSGLGALKQPWLFRKNLAGGGVLLDLGLQLIDTSWWLAGKPQLLRATASSRQIDTSLKVEDFLNLQLQFAENLHMSFTFSWHFPTSKDRFTAEIYGLSGNAAVVPLKIEKSSRGKSLDVTPPLYAVQPRTIFQAAYHNEILHFANFLLGREKRLESDILEAIQVMEMIDKIYESLKTGKTVKG